MPKTKRVTVLIDWKSGTFLAPEMRLQLGSYYSAPQTYDKATGQSGIKPAVDYGCILHTSEKGVYPLLVMNQSELTEAARIFTEAVRIYRYLATHGNLPEPQRYQINGTAYVSTTEVLKYVIAKPGLLNWYAKMAAEGKDPNAVRDARGVAGSTIHKNILFFMQGRSVDLTQAPPELAKTMALFAAWTGKWNVDAVALEQTVIDQPLGVAGTLDAILSCDAGWVEGWYEEQHAKREAERHESVGE